MAKFHLLFSPLMGMNSTVMGVLVQMHIPVLHIYQTISYMPLRGGKIGDLVGAMDRALKWVLCFLLEELPAILTSIPLLGVPIILSVSVKNTLMREWRERIKWEAWGENGRYPPGQAGNYLGYFTSMFWGSYTNPGDTPFDRDVALGDEKGKFNTTWWDSIKPWEFINDVKNKGGDWVKIGYDHLMATSTVTMGSFILKSLTSMAVPSSTGYPTNWGASTYPGKYPRSAALQQWYLS